MFRKNFLSNLANRLWLGARVCSPNRSVELTLIFTFLCVVPIQAQTLTGLGDLPGGSTFSEALGVSADGSVVVGTTVSTLGQEAFRWTSSTGLDSLGDLSGGLYFNIATAVSADGSVIVGSSNSSMGYEAFRWTSSGGMVGLGSLPSGAFVSESSAVSSDGSVVVGSSDNQAFYWTGNDGMIGLGFLPGGGSSLGRGVSADGSVIVGSGNSSSSSADAFRQIFFSPMSSIGNLPGGSFSSVARGISDNGLVIVGESSSTNGIEAFRWTESTGMIGLGDLAGGFFGSRALAVSGDGSVIVGYGSTTTADEGFVWTESAGMRSLNDVLNDFGVDVNVWTVLGEANDISSDGRTIVGRGSRNGNLEAYVADFHNLDLHWTHSGSGNWDDLSNWTSSVFVPGSGDHTILDFPTGLTVTGPSQPITVDGLTVGNSSNNGTTTLQLQPTGNLTVNGSSTIAICGRLAGEGTLQIGGSLTNRGEIDLGNGTLQLTGGLITNENGGLIHGDGEISQIENISGELRIASGERIFLTDVGNQINFDEINLLGGTLETNGTLCNDSGFVGGRGTIIVHGDFFNGGVFAFSGGFTDLFGNLEIYSNGIVVSSGGASTTFYDDVLHDGIEIRTSAACRTTFFGACSGSGPFTGTGDVYMEGDLRPGNSPAAISFEGNLILGSLSSVEIEIGGLIPGTEHDQLTIAGDVDLAGTLNVSLINGFEIAPGQQFQIVEVDGNVNGTFSGLSEGDLVGNFAGEDLFITYVGGDGNDVVLFTDDPVILLGDVNLDGSVNLLDVDPFIDRISTATFQAEADINQDGVVNLLDVDPFIVLLSGG